MRARKILWGLPLLGYLLFSFWYTNTGGPLSAAEVEHYLGKMQTLGRSDESLKMSPRKTISWTNPASIIFKVYLLT